MCKETSTKPGCSSHSPSGKKPDQNQEESRFSQSLPPSSSAPDSCEEQNPFFFEISHDQEIESSHKVFHGEKGDLNPLNPDSKTKPAQINYLEIEKLSQKQLSSSRPAEDCLQDREPVSAAVPVQSAETSLSQKAVTPYPTPESSGSSSAPENQPDFQPDPGKSSNCSETLPPCSVPDEQEDFHLPDLKEHYEELDKKTRRWNGWCLPLKAVCMIACLIAAVAGASSMYIMASDMNYDPVEENYVVLRNIPTFQSIHGPEAGSLLRGEVVYIEESCVREGKKWGKLDTGNWVILEDRMYTYMEKEVDSIVTNTRAGGFFTVLEDTLVFPLPTGGCHSLSNLAKGKVVFIEETWMDEDCSIWGKIDEYCWVKISASGRELLHRIPDPQIDLSETGNPEDTLKSNEQPNDTSTPGLASEDLSWNQAKSEKE